MYNIENYDSVMQVKASSVVTDRYSFIPTTQVLDVFKSQGWIPSKIKEASTRIEENKGYQKHMIRLRQDTVNRQVGDLFPEIVLTNSHCGSASFQVMAGLFRLVCLNGLTVADSTFQTHRIKHVGYTDQKVIDAIYSVVSETPKILEKVEEFKSIELSKEEKQIFSESILDVVFEEDVWEKGKTPGTTADKHNTASLLMLPRRSEDRQDNLWALYNIAQENIIKKGVTLVSENPRYRVGNKTRAVKSIDRDIKLNKALWSLTEKMAELKR